MRAATQRSPEMPTYPPSRRPRRQGSSPKAGSEEGESSESLLSLGAFALFAELLCQAGPEVALFPKNPSGMSSTSQARRRRVPAASYQSWPRDTGTAVHGHRWGCTASRLSKGKSSCRADAAGRGYSNQLRGSTPGSAESEPRHVPPLSERGSHPSLAPA